MSDEELRSILAQFMRGQAEINRSLTESMQRHDARLAGQEETLQRLDRRIEAETQANQTFREFVQNQEGVNEAFRESMRQQEERLNRALEQQAQTNASFQEKLDRALEQQAQQLAAYREDQSRNAERFQSMESMLQGHEQMIRELQEGQALLVQYFQQEHDARIEDRRRFNRFMDSQEIINDRLLSTIERLDAGLAELRRYIRFTRENGSAN
ncbi:MAG: hypothetical protein Q6M04_01475 [Thermostichus sp. BF3_bins_97]